MSTEVTDAGIGPALGDAGPPARVVSGGKTWLIGHPTQKAKRELELLVVEAAQANIDALKPIYSAAKYQAKCDELTLQVEGGHYKTHGSLWATVNNGPDGQPLFLAALLRELQPEVTIAQATALWLGEPQQVRRAMALVVPDFFALLAESLPLPPEGRRLWQDASTAEALAALGQPLAPTASGSSERTTP